MTLEEQNKAVLDKLATMMQQHHYVLSVTRPAVEVTDDVWDDERRYVASPMETWTFIFDHSRSPNDNIAERTTD